MVNNAKILLDQKFAIIDNEKNLHDLYKERLYELIRQRNALKDSNKANLNNTIASYISDRYQSRVDGFISNRSILKNQKPGKRMLLKGYKNSGNRQIGANFAAKH